MPDLSDRVAASLRQTFPNGGRLAVGYSGGLDSSVLLHVLVGLRPSLGLMLSAVHVHHGLSVSADAWAEHCQAECGKLDVPLQVHRVCVQPAGEGLEAAARVARYQVFAGLHSDALALAHQRDDQAETVLLQLLRGAGMKGLAAMPAVRRLAGGRVLLLRPLLDIPRGELAAWAEAQALDWIEDESNVDPRHARNALRHDVMPELRDRFPACAATLAKAAGQFAEAASLLDALADLDGQHAVSPEGLAVARLAALPEPRARNLLRRHLEQGGAVIRQEALREALRQILAAAADARVRVDFGERSLYRYRGRVSLVRSGPPSADRAWLWHGEESVDLAGLGRLRFQPAREGGVRLEPGKVAIRARAGGERLRLHAGRPRRDLKDLLREAGIPPWRRHGLPLLYLGEELAWVAEIGADVAFRSAPGEAGWLISWQRT